MNSVAHQGSHCRCFQYSGSRIPSARSIFQRLQSHASLRMGAKFDSRTIVFSRHAPPASAPSGVEFVNGAIGPFVSRLREQPGKCSASNRLNLMSWLSWSFFSSCCDERWRIWRSYKSAVSRLQTACPEVTSPAVLGWVEPRVYLAARLALAC